MRSSEKLERRCGSTAFGKTRALEKAKAAEEVDSPVVRKVWRRKHGKAVAGIVVVILQGDYGKVAFCAVFSPTLAVEHKGVFAYGHAVNARYWLITYARFQFGFQNGSVYEKTVGVRAVHHYYGYVVFCSGLHYVLHRVYVSVKTASHILNVEKEYIYAFEKLGFRFFGFTAVKRKHGNACLFVHIAVYYGSVVGQVPETVFGCEYLDYVYTAFHKEIDEMASVTKQSGLIAHKGDFFPLEKMEVKFGTVGCGNCRPFCFLRTTAD